MHAIPAVFVLALVASMAATAHAAPVDAIDGFAVTSWGRQDGAPAGNIRALAQDADGYLWLGTDGGLFRFDGFRFEPWSQIGAGSLAGSAVRALYMARDRSLWVVFRGESGVTRIRDLRARNYGETDGLPLSRVMKVVEDRSGGLWISSQRGVYGLTGDRWTQGSLGAGLPSGPFFSAHQDRQGRLFVGTADSLYEKPADGPFVRRAGLNLENDGVQAQAICASEAGKVFATNPLIGFQAIGDPPRRVTAAEQGIGLAIHCDRRGTVWVGTAGAGLWRVTPTSRERRDATSIETGLLADGAFAIIEDRNGHIWVGSTDGVHRLVPNDVKHVSGIGMVVTVEGTRDGTVWAGTFDGLIELGKKSDTWLPLQKRLAGARVRALHADTRDTLWVATNRGVVGLTAGARTLASLAEARTLLQVSSISSDARGTLWLYDVERGLLRSRGDQLEQIDLPPELTGVPRTAIHLDRHDRLWIVGAGGVGWRDRDGRVKRFGVADGLTGGPYSTVYEDDAGAIWLVGPSGLTLFRNERLETVRTSQPDETDAVVTIVEDRLHRVWLGMASGGFLLNKHPVDGTAENDTIAPDALDVFDGLSGRNRRLSNKTAARASDGTLWFVTDEGVGIVDPTAVSHDEPAVPARVSMVLADDQVLPPTSPARLPARTRRVEIAYAALNLASPHRTRFRYRLDGFDTKWVDAGPARTASYTSLPPGSYQFRLMATTDGGDWQGQEATWNFSVAPVFYQTAWFMLASVMGIGLAAWGAWHFRMTQVRSRFQIMLGERARISREIHDTLLQSFVGVALQCDAIADGAEAPTTRDRVLQLRRQVEEHIREAREAIWNLRSPTLDRYDLATALRRAGERAVEGTRLTFECAVTGTVRPCPRHVEQELLRVGQEALSNAIRHAQAQRIRLQLEYGPEAIVLRVIDDGRGFAVAHAFAARTDHCGVISMRERVASVGGQFAIISEPGNGTTVQAIVSLAGVTAA